MVMAKGITSGYVPMGAVAVSGAVDYVATVLRLKTPDGTLVIEADDPNITIKVDGNDLVVTGAGLKELRLPVGPHNVQAVKDGKTLQQELVTIVRGGRTVLTVRRDEASRARDPAAEVVHSLTVREGHLIFGRCSGDG